MMNTWNPAELNQKINAGGSGSGSGGLPPITPADAGKYPVVDNEGKWALAEGGFLPDYSTEEVATGQKWIDGKELYQKVISYDIATLGLPSGTIIDTGVSDADFMFIDKYMLIFPSGSYAGTYTGEHVGSYDLNMIITSDFKIQSMSTSSNFDPGEGRKFYVIIKYTRATPTKKTTKKK
jgi:hypothetical protein